MTSTDPIDHDTLITATNRLGRRLPDLVVDGVPESDIWAYAPVMDCDRVHWDTIEPFDPAEVLPHLDMPAWTRTWSDGQCRVWVPAGSGYDARESIRTWCADADVEIVNARVEAGVTYRDIDSIPAPLRAGLFQAAVEWLYPRMVQVRRRLVTDLDLVEDDDIPAMMYLFVSDHADRFDSGRAGRNGTLNFLAFLVGKMKTWPQDLARAAYGRTAVADRLAMNRAVDALTENAGRHPSEADVADALGITVAELRRREAAIVTLSSFRHYDSITLGDDGAEERLPASDDVTQTTIDYARDAALTRAVINAVSSSGVRHAEDPLALAALYLTFWEGLTRADAARDLGVMPKTVAAATARTLESIDAEDLR